MTPSDDEVLRELVDIKAQLTTLVSLYKMANEDTIERLKSELLKTEIRRKIYDSCDGTKTVAQIAQIVDPQKPVETSMKLVSHYLTELESKGMLAHRDEKRQRYYFRTLE